MILYLALKKKWYRLTECGSKLEEYREINEYWVKRLTFEEHYESVEQLLSKPIKFKEFSSVVLTLGYPKKDDKTKRVYGLIKRISANIDGRDTDLEINEPVFDIEFKLIKEQTNEK